MDISLGTIAPAAAGILFVLAAFGITWLLKAEPINLLFVHVVTRILLDSAPEYTYIKLAGGLSFMQIYSAGFTGLGILYLVMRERLAAHSYYTAPLVAIIFAYAVSTVISGAWLEFATATLRWIYMWVLIALTLYAMSRGSERIIMLSICFAGMYAFLNQMYSVATNTPKWGAGMWTYVGTYKHESDICFIFVMMAPAAIYFLTCSNSLKDKLFGVSCLVATCIGLYYGSYRSVWIAFAGYAGMYLWHNYLRGNITSRVFWIASSSAGTVVIVATVGPAIFEKMIDLFSFISAPQQYLDFSGQAEKISLMSGRVDLINSYMGIYLNSGVHVLFGGIGPGQGSNEVGLYAHNEYLSALVETGLIGFFAVMWLIIRFFNQASSLSRSELVGAQVAAPFFMVMAVSCLGTMPFRDMRAMLAMGLMMGITEWYSKQREKRVVQSPIKLEGEVQFLS